MNTWEELEGRREYLKRNAENETRSAYAYARYRTTGWGETTFDGCFEFGLTFIEEPFVNYGMALSDDGPDLDGKATRYPRAWGGVYRWKKNTNGFYTGAWMFTIVETQSYYIPTALTDPNYIIDHSFTFYGKATKYMPDYLAER